MTLLALLAACTPIDTGFGKPDPDPADTADTGQPDDTAPIDTADTDGDQDDDGFTPEDGDCDDTDFRVSPAREEDPEDTADNDCDGRVNEEWAGFSVAYVTSDGEGQIRGIDVIGNEDGSVDLGSACVPVFLDHHAGGGWVVSTISTLELVATDGTCTTLADFSETDYGVMGVAEGPDGTIYASTLDSLVSVAADGTVTTLASWSVDEELAPYGIAVSWETGEVALFDYIGGFATWSAEDGFAIRLAPNFDSPALYTLSGAHRDRAPGREPGWFVPAYDFATGAYGIHRFDEAANAWVEEETWTETDFEPFMLAIEGETGDYYVTASKALYEVVWRIRPNSDFADDFHVNEDQGGVFYGIVGIY